MPDLTPALNALLDLPGVQDAITEAGDACTRLRWHAALRRRIPQAAAESRVRGARASAALEGAELDLSLVRDVMRGARVWPQQPDPVEQTVQAAVRATAESEHVVALLRTSPAQAVARLQVSAMSDLLPSPQVGRPRLGSEDCHEFLDLGPAPAADEARDRLDQALALLQWSGSGVLVAALVHAEIVSARPFVRGNGIVARALARAALISSGVDPTGVAVPEAGHLAEGTAGYVGALAAYGRGDEAGVGLWLRSAASAVTVGAAEGERVADAVLAGRLS